MSDNKQSLLLFQLGPVQSFIAQAQTVGDLAVGSAILSEITKAAIQKVPDYKSEEVLVFPSTKGNENLEGIPNRFLAFVPKGEGEKIAVACADAAREALVTLADETYKIFNRDHPGKLDNPAAFLAQVNQFLQITWVVLENPTREMGKDYKAIGKLMAMRRNTREFDQWQEESDGQPKDVLSGKEVALCKGLGAMNLIKRYHATQTKYEDALDKLLKNEKDKYIAVIAMDGDKMGEALSNFKDIDEHRKFSEKLGQFANSVSEDLSKNKDGEKESLLIYAGGDDVLAVVKATDAIGVAKKLQERFKKMVGNTASAGIAIGHSSVPLQDLVHAAHAAESRAKNSYHRDALAISIYKRSGEILEWGCGWDSPALDIYDELTTLSEEDKAEEISIGRFPYKLAALLQPYELKGEVDGAMLPIVMAEYDHAVEQTKDMRKDKVDRLSRDKVEAYLKACFEKKPEDVKEQEKKKSAGRAEDFLNLFMAETFINRPREGEE